jgi:glycerol-3-phosphate dehydrogenase
MKRVSLKELEGQTFDVLIIGGGITGASAAREAALRGLSTVLVEKNDFASGTSSRSTKLIHGGVRYLQSYQFKLVREACSERERMLRLAPHLSNVRPFIYALYEGYPESMALLNAGLTVYDLFSGSPLKRRHRMLNAQKLLEVEPHLNPSGLVGGGWYYDFLTDDARFTLDTLKGAWEAGALLGNYMEVVGFVQESGRIAGVELRDRLSGEEGTAHARQVINAAGPWVDRVRFLEKGEQKRMLRPTKGVHIALLKRDFPLNHAVFLRSPRDNRVVWPIPALDEELVYIGTTDTDYDGSLDEVTASEQDVAYLLEVANHTIPDAKLGFEHVISTWAGLRPLVKPAAQEQPAAGEQPEGEMAASSVSREHQIFESPGGLLNIAGGKLTTARVMGQQVIQAALRRLRQNHGLKGFLPSRSAYEPISGGDPGQTLLAQRTAAGLQDLDPAVKARWLKQYGGNFLRLAEIYKQDPASGSDLGCSHLSLAEVRYAVQEEMACTLTDFFTRRASLFYWRRDGGLAAAEPVAAEMGRLLGWDEAESQRQIQSYQAWVAANRFEAVNTQEGKG